MTRNKTFNFLWIILMFVLLFGLLPVTIPDLSDNFKNPNVLLINRQECGCPCAEGVIKKGKLIISQEILDKYPKLRDNHFEITLTNFSPYNDISNDKPETFDFANFNSFKVTGQVIGVDTILCNPNNYEIVPKFQVTDWKLTRYYPKFLKFSSPIMLLYLGLWCVALPTLTITTIYKAKRKRKN
ncbi:MAG: hypothetical protein OQJ96_01030 [Flavobacteriales bacterium]|nr:hypothetical protein [Flavobacteriales bacterium]MCW8911881.1 hypothetical protein [Flavobacteriales bacterium]MCW8936348.1 hypothetical protein [Flavobacteriales bacterium]MCW8939119.1 hypothetical protein [Flavobacteriales bacterium]MCW8966950.1 hypothetical protein [Flavobacteriales bacterium]